MTKEPELDEFDKLIEEMEETPRLDNFYDLYLTLASVEDAMFKICEAKSRVAGLGSC